MNFDTPLFGNKYTILVIDDDPFNINLIRDVMAGDAYQIVGAGSGEEGLDLIRKTRPDLILLDVIMPGLSGYEVLEEIKKNHEFRLIPIIMITALYGQGDRLKGLDMGVDDFISKPVNVFELRARIKNLLKLRAYINELEHAEQVIFSLARAVEAKDKYTEGHCERLSSLAEELGRQLGMEGDDLTILRRGGILHDIGKIAIPESILLKPGPLTKKEFEVIKTHPEEGERICAPLKSLRPALPTIRHHQERFNGSGYPDGLSGDEIPIHARIIGIVDCFDALTTKRPYRDALSEEEAIRIMQEETERGLWDPEIINVFFPIVKNTSEFANIVSRLSS